MFEVDDDARFARQMTQGKSRSNDPWANVKETPVAIDTPIRSNKLDDEHNTNMFDKLIGHYRRELVRQDGPRRDMAMDHDFYDGKQLSDAMESQMRERGQTPLTFNVISQVVNWMLGTERRARSDYKVLPRTEEASKAAERKSQILKYLSDVNRTPFHWSRSFADACKGGIGWIESGVQEDTDGEPLYSRYESWRNVIWDSMATELDMSDARYIFRAKWADIDIAKTMFPDRKHIIDIASTTTLAYTRALDETGDEAMDSIELENEAANPSSDSLTYDYRERVRLVEAWFRVPVPGKYMKGGQFSGEVYDSTSRGHVNDIITGRASVVPKVRMRMHVAIFTEAGLLFMSRSPYRHNKFPFTPVWCYRRDRDNMPYGLVRQMRDPQIDINNRASRALFILNTNKVVMDEGAVGDMATFLDEVNRPNGVIIKKAGKQLELNADRGLESAHMDMMSRSIMMVQSMSGVTDESMGKTTNATSGRAIEARQNQGGLATAPIFDNLRLAKQIAGEKELSLIEQFVSEEKVFRITNQRGRPEFIRVNDDLPENDIVSSKADFIIAEDDFSSTIRQAQVEELLALMRDLAATSPQIVLTVIDLIVESMDVPNREELVKRIRQVTGMEDPDADPENPDPETVARKQAEAEQMEFQKRAAMAELRKTEAEAGEKEARSEKAAAETRKLAADIRRIIAQTEGESVDTQVRALQAAAQLLSAPQLGMVADQVLDAAGYQDRTDLSEISRLDRVMGQGTEIAPQQPAQAPQEAMPPMEQQPQAAPAPQPEPQF